MRDVMTALLVSSIGRVPFCCPPPLGEWLLAVTYPGISPLKSMSPGSSSPGHSPERRSAPARLCQLGLGALLNLWPASPRWPSGSERLVTEQWEGEAGGTSQSRAYLANSGSAPRGVRLGNDDEQEEPGGAVCER